MAESGGAGPADSYIGSLLSLTSKSDIRYEGVLYRIDTENSNIALQNVRSFGTEGRQNNGPHIPPNDKVFEFIIFRGTDIKDLQVKMSPPPPIHNDPAIISLQAQVSQPAAVPPYMVPPPTDVIGNHSTYKASSAPYYHTAGSGVPLWAPPPPPPQVPSGSIPYYWQGFYRPQDEHRLLEPTLGLDSAPIPAQVLPTSVTSATPSFPSPLRLNQALTQASTTSTSTYLPSPGSMGVSQAETMYPARVGLGTSLPVSDAQPSSSSFTNAEDSVSLQERSHVDVPHLKPDTTKGKPFNEVRSGGSSGVSRPTLTSSAAQGARKAPGRSHQVYKQVYRQVQVTKDTFNSGHQVPAAKSQSPPAQPLLPLPISPPQHRAFFEVHEGVSRANSMRRGGYRGGGVGRSGRNAHSRSKLLEDFDFIAMNEKFNKEEVWDELLHKDRVSEDGGALQGVEYGFETEGIEKDFDRGLSELSKKSVYVKDEFFDSLSCDALDREHGRPERLKFSEQRRIDAETFGSSHLRTYHGGGASRGRHGGSGGRGQARGGGRGRGGYGYRGFRG